MGTGAFIFASKYSEQGLLGTAVLGPMTFVVYTFVKLVREVSFKCRTGSWVKSKNSVWITDEGKIRWSSLIPLLNYIIFNIAYVLVMTVAWRFARKAGLNQGVITTNLFFASIINCVTFYCFFGEKISKLNLIGVALMCLAIGCFMVAAALNSEDDIDEDVDTGGRSPLENGFLALTIGFGGPCIISAQ